MMNKNDTKDRVYCIHHDDNDGRLSAAIVNAWCINNAKAFCSQEMNYNQILNTDDIPADSTVVMVDFSLSELEMAALIKTVGKSNIIWIDHHKTAEAYSYSDLAGVRDFNEPGLSAAELTFKWCFPDKPVPRVVVLVGDYDTWQHQHAPFDIHLHQGTMLEDTSPASSMWQELLWGDNRRLISILDNGQHIIAYRDKYCAEMLSKYGYETDFDGLKCLALNVYRFGSHAFGLNMSKYDAVIAYVYDGSNYVVSMYSDKAGVDVASICRHYGGGGHTKAAGFTAAILPFKKKETKIDVA